MLNLPRGTQEYYLLILENIHNMHGAKHVLEEDEPGDVGALQA